MTKSRPTKCNMPSRLTQNDPNEGRIWRYFTQLLILDKIAFVKHAKLHTNGHYIK
jgi:hypothetical protein